MHRKQNACHQASGAGWTAALVMTATASEQASAKSNHPTQLSMYHNPQAKWAGDWADVCAITRIDPDWWPVYHDPHTKLTG